MKSEKITRAMTSASTAGNAADGRIPVGISSCLLGEAVRFDGGHKRDAYINGTLTRYFELIPFCPEMAAGLGVPRAPIRLVTIGSGPPRALGVRNPTLDATDALEHVSHALTPTLSYLCGFILKRGSPSCGMQRVKIYSNKGIPAQHGTGIFARILMEKQPLLPVEEEGRLGDAVLRENFIERVFVYRRWRCLAAGGLTPSALSEFHARHKLLIMAHSQVGYRRLGRLAANAGSGSLEEVGRQYITDLMTTLKRPATKKTHTNVLQHLSGYLKRSIDAQDKAELLEVIERYRLGELPLIVPITLLNHHFRRHPHPYVARQHYLKPHPRELMLRNGL